jgi:hypothetical protein
MMAWLQAIENSSWAVWLKASPSFWGYPMLLFLHTLGISFSAGPSVAIDLRILGLARRLPLAPLDAFFKVIWIAFAVNAASGLVLFASDATAKLANPAYLVKMLFVAAAAGVTVAIRKRVFTGANSPLEDAVGGAGRWLAVGSIVCWFGAITAGRFIAYFDASPF